MNKLNVKIKRLGVWMDHSEAKLIDPDLEIGIIQIIHSEASDAKRFAGESSDGTQLGNYRSTNNEVHKHRKEENDLQRYFKNLADHLKSYDQVFLFGPTTAAHEFNNYLLKEKMLSTTRIHLQKTDYLTDNQMVKEVKLFFLNQ